MISVLVIWFWPESLDAQLLVKNKEIRQALLYLCFNLSFSLYLFFCLAFFLFLSISFSVSRAFSFFLFLSPSLFLSLFPSFSLSLLTYHV